MKTSALSLVGALWVALATPVSALNFVISTGDAAPPSALGPYPLTAFPSDDPRSGFVSEVASPLGGVVGFSSDMEVLTIGAGWATWSHGYSGDVYAVDLAVLNADGKYEVTLNLPALTTAFLFYAEPAIDGGFDISARLDDGTSLTQEIQGDSGAKGFGFWAQPGAFLSSITVLSEFQNVDFAIGEFAIARLWSVPDEGAMGTVLLGFGVMAVGLARRRFARAV